MPWNKPISNKTKKVFFQAFVNRVGFLTTTKMTGITAATCLAIPLNGCTGVTPPSQSDVNAARSETPKLNTIQDGEAYIAAGRDELFLRKQKLIGAEVGFDGGILGGVVLSGLGAALKWHSQTNTRTAIFTAAALGTDSALSIPQQIAIVDKALDAIQCVESQANSNWKQLYAYNGPLEAVQIDVENLKQEVKQATHIAVPTDDLLSSEIDTASNDIVLGDIWLDTNSVPIMSVDGDVKVAVDSVIQTANDQFDRLLPDGSAFNSISSMFHTSASTTQITSSNTIPISSGSVTAVSSGASDSTPAFMEAKDGVREIDTNSQYVTLEVSLKSLETQLQQDMKASTMLGSLNPSGSITFSTTACSTPS